MSDERCVSCGSVVPEGRQVCPLCETRAFAEALDILPDEKGGEGMSVKWWKAAGIRALKTLCQTAVATIGTSVVLQDVNWIAVVSASALAAVLSLLTSLAGLPEVDE